MIAETDDLTHQHGSVRPAWISLTNLETNLQQSDGRNNKDASAQAVHEDVQKAQPQHEEDVQLRWSTRQPKPPSYLQDFVTGGSSL
jgi:hypothetical protein